MTAVAARFPDDALVAAVQAEAVMNLAPWLLCVFVCCVRGARLLVLDVQCAGALVHQLRCMTAGVTSFLLRCNDRYDTRSDFDPASGPPGSGRVPNAYGLEAKAAIERGLACAPHDVWLAHLKVHFNEMG